MQTFQRGPVNTIKKLNLKFNHFKFEINQMPPKNQKVKPVTENKGGSAGGQNLNLSKNAKNYVIFGSWKSFRFL